MTTAPSRLTSSTGSSCFLTSGIAVQVPRLFFLPWRFNPSFCSPYTLISRATCSIFRGAPLYCFTAEYQKNCNTIILHPDWIQYLEENYTIVRGWASWEWLNYMQQRNPNTPNVVKKLFMPQKRDSLTNQTKYWKTILEYRDIECIYSKVRLKKNEFSLDHYLPWSFVAHAQLWNLIPTTKSVNSSKSNNLPSGEYFHDFVSLQDLGLTIYKQNVSQKKMLKRY